MELYAVQVRFFEDYGYTSEEIRWELCTNENDWRLYTRPPARYYNGHEILSETAIYVTSIEKDDC